jgi:hypothetical protein
MRSTGGELTDRYGRLVVGSGSGGRITGRKLQRLEVVFIPVGVQYLLSVENAGGMQSALRGEYCSGPATFCVNSGCQCSLEKTCLPALQVCNHAEFACTFHFSRSRDAFISHPP